MPDEMSFSTPKVYAFVASNLNAFILNSIRISFILLLDLGVSLNSAIPGLTFIEID